MRLIAFYSLIFLLFGSGVFASESHWPGWLGSNRNGHVTGVSTPAQWPKALKRQWAVPTGAGYGSALVSQGRVYQHARQGEEEVVLCLDLKTGKTLWRQGILTPFTMGQGGQRHGKGPKSTPCLDDGRLFTMSITGTLSAWDVRTGDALWQKDYGSRFGKKHPYWGTSNSPLVDGSQVIHHFGNDKQGSLMALDVRTGKEKWSQGREGTCYASPLVAAWNGVRQIVVWNHEALIGVDSQSGKRLWAFPFPHTAQNQNMPSPILHEGRLYVGGENRGVRCVEPRLQDGRWTVSERWHQRKVALDMSTAIINNDLLFGLSHYERGRIFCLDIDTGKIHWLGPERAGQHATFLSLSSHVLALTNSGELQVLSATSQGYRKVASCRVSQGQTWAPPVLVEEGLLVKDEETLTLWTFP